MIPGESSLVVLLTILDDLLEVVGAVGSLGAAVDLFGSALASLAPAVDLLVTTVGSLVSALCLLGEAVAEIVEVVDETVI